MGDPRLVCKYLAAQSARHTAGSATLGRVGDLPEPLMSELGSTGRSGPRANVRLARRPGGGASAGPDLHADGEALCGF